MKINWSKPNLKQFSCTSPVTHKEEDFTGRAEKIILDSGSIHSDDTSLKGNGNNAIAKMSAAGMDCMVRNLYPDKKGRWTEKYPTWLGDPVENDQTKRFALIVRHKKVESTQKKLEIESISIQSPLLKRALVVVFQDYPGVTADLEQLEFKAPFKPFVHRWPKFEQATVNERDPQAKQHLALLWNVLETELRPFLANLKDLTRRGLIDYKSLWAIYEPGSLLVIHSEGGERLFRCIDTKGLKEGHCKLDLQFIDWDGERFGLATDGTKIASFIGTMPITSLRAKPLDRHPDRAGIERRVLQKAKVFEALKGYHFRAYKGTGIDATGFKVARFNVESRVIIDTAAFNLFNPDDQVRLSGLDKSPRTITTNRRDSDSDSDSDSEAEVVSESEDEDLRAMTSAKRRRFSASQVPPLRYDQLLICNDSVRAFSMKDNKWLRLFVDSLTDIKWNSGAFPGLVLPADTKDLLLAFAESQVKRHQKFDDVIQGKGLGTIMLLSGPPGVGKTLTAESIAEEMHVPLYMLSAGDLGTDPKDVESVLSKTFEMATKWRAVLLLDEADVFLLARNTHDLERNKLVSIFLRMLEYYQGFLFLTTNRVQDIDDAFESRIQLHLQYAELDFACRQAVWRNFLSISDPADGEFTDQRISELARTEMNGRQIKNVIKPAQLLAARHESQLRLEHVQTVMKLKADNQVKKHLAVPW